MNNDNIQEFLAKLETAISNYESGSEVDPLPARLALRELLAFLSGAAETGTSITKTLAASRKVENKNARRIGVIIIRCLGVDGLMPNNSEEPGSELEMVDFVERSLPDFSKHLNLNGKRQTYEKYNEIRSFHSRLIEGIAYWRSAPQTIEGLLSNKEPILKCISANICKSYLEMFGIKSVASALNELFELLEMISRMDEEFHVAIEKMKVLTSAQRKYVEDHIHFLNGGYYSILLEKFVFAVSQIEEDSVESFKCDLVPINTGPYIASKKYPLHNAAQEILIRIPLRNSGPGIAKDVVVEFFEDPNSKISLNSILNIGNIRKGIFELAIEAIVLEPAIEAKFEFLISWREQNASVKRERTELCVIQAQREYINWSLLVYEEPYSTEVAEGEEFIGREKKLNSLLSRLLKPRMQSTYITGQKRVGKTSLARATISKLNEHVRGSGIRCHYVEWGDIAKPDSNDAVEALGRNIAMFLIEDVDPKIDISDFDFKGSISSLNEIANLLQRSNPEAKYLVVIDEFDEIHPEMYRYGQLAETFFSNLRTLSSKANMAFMLVGGENMPFVLNAQGDQLNKFVAESVDYFSETEYPDYEELVRRPTVDILTWSNASIRELFYITNGHPFYTKLVCSKVFEMAVHDRDAEVTDREVRVAVGELIETLESNSFAHLWRDSIQKTERAGESIILNRCRCLVALGVCVREGMKLTTENIYESRRYHILDRIQIVSLLNDFVRRNILLEESGVYTFRVPLFERWLTNKGIRVLIADLIGDEFASEKVLADEKLRVTESEIDSLARSWHPYRGQEITSEKIRHWLCQVAEIEEQRILFRLLKHVRFYSEIDIREKLRLAFEFLKPRIPVKVETVRNAQKKDILVSYIDGEGKSGQYYASKFSEEARIPVRCIIPADQFTSKATRYESNDDVTVNAVVFVDDIAASGNSLSANLKKFISDNEVYIRERSLLLLVVVLVATDKGDSKISREVSKYREEGFNIEFRVCEALDSKHTAFKDGEFGIWSDETECHKARALCRRLGSILSPRAPLGFLDSGLLVVFPDRCPNNSLPILHSYLKSEKLNWQPLFERPLN